MEGIDLVPDVATEADLQTLGPDETLVEIVVTTLGIVAFWGL